MFTEPASTPPNAKKMSWGRFLDGDDDDADDMSEDAASLLRKEIDLYTSLPTLRPKDACPLKWWAEHESTFPSIAKLARKYLCVQATSVASERAFSGAGNIVSARRTALKPARVNELCFLSANLQL